MRTHAILILCILFGSILSSCSLSAEQEKQDTESKNYAGPIIDMHLHAFKNPSPLFGQDMPPNPLTGKSYKASASLEAHKEECFAIFEKHKIVKAFVSQYAEDWKEAAPDLILSGKGQSFPIEELREIHAKGQLDIIGEVAPNYQGLLPTDEGIRPYFDLAEELQIPIAYHMYPGGPPGGAYFAYPKTRANQVKPLALEEILLKRPSMKIYIMHSGWPYLEDMKALMYAHLQVYVDLGVISWALPKAEFHHFLKGLVQAGFGKRIMFGSDQMEWPGTIEEAIEAVNSADFLSLEQKEDIFYNNAASFLELSAEEIAQHKAL
ncbi:MAG: amidohydrolase family protein [Bacteroidia bacterium]|nr:amidohydrolase family protein [Bacteroidia bacterium]